MLDILSKTIIAEEAVVRKAGGKFKMNPLFPSTVAKIQKVRSLKTMKSQMFTYLIRPEIASRGRYACARWNLDNS